jgi:hypothetical protein
LTPSIQPSPICAASSPIQAMVVIAATTIATAIIRRTGPITARANSVGTSAQRKAPAPNSSMVAAKCNKRQMTSAVGMGWLGRDGEIETALRMMGIDRHGVPIDRVDPRRQLFGDLDDEDGVVGGVDARLAQGLRRAARRAKRDA